MASGKGHSKGFHYYMSKKFFHPANPQNLEAVFVAKQNHVRREQEEREKLSEYQREQEAYNAKETLAILKGKSQLDRDKLSLNFMYEPPVGVRNSGTQIKEVAQTDDNLKLTRREAPQSLTGGTEGNFCFTCNTEGHVNSNCPKNGEMLFEWQRTAPREASSKNDPNIIDKPFGIQVVLSHCMRCKQMGHSHTEKFCPMYGKAKDHDEPETFAPVDEKKLIAEMRDKEGLAFNSFDVWDNGKTKKGRKEYDMVYASEGEEGVEKDFLVNLVTRMKTKKKKKVKVKKEKDIKKEKDGTKQKSRRKAKGIKKEKDIKEEKFISDSESDSNPSPKKRKKKRKSEKKSKKKYKRSKVKIEEIDLGDSTDEGEAPDSNQLTAVTMEKIDDILFANIGKKSQKEMLAEFKKNKNYMSEVDRILRVGGDSEGGFVKAEANSSGDSSSASSSGDSSDDGGIEILEDEEELSEAEMRLLNIININKIDVKLNFPEEYPDTACHFCREPEDSRHLARCPVYTAVMRGTEFDDIKSESVGRVRRALAGIRAALLQRSRALSFTSVGAISKKNMQLLTLSEGGDGGPGAGERDRRMAEILGDASVITVLDSP